jgi:transposase-like protein
MKSPLTKELFAKLYKSGTPIAEITKTLGICHRTVDSWRKALNLPRRRKA